MDKGEANILREKEKHLNHASNDSLGSSIRICKGIPEKWEEDVDLLNSLLTIPTVISIKKVSLTDIRPVLRIPTSQIAYFDIRKLKDYTELRDWITAHIQSVLCIDNIDDLKFCDENFQASQLLFHLIRQEEYIDGETHIDFTNTKTIILYEEKREKEGYNFSSYASRSSIQFTL